MNPKTYTKKAYKTLYKGVIFDSYLESRWARFFDSLGVEWAKPTQGFLGGSENKSWLPDFRVVFPDGAVWLVEVKPNPSFLQFEKYAIGVYRGYNVAFCFGQPSASLSVFWKEATKTFREQITTTNPAHEELWDETHE